MMIALKKCYLGSKIIKMKYILTAIISAFILFSSTAQEWKTQIGQDVPSFEVMKKDGQTISTDDLKGKVVLINFFATWCPPCRMELPKVQEEIWDVFLEREDFEIIVLAREEGWNKLDPFLEEYGYTFPFYPDLNRKVFSLFAENTIPRNVIIDRDGKIVYQSIGYSQEEFDSMFQVIADQLGAG